jgi:ubiquinone/menaquinone biosynthesis C-methylase UbiE
MSPEPTAEAYADHLFRAGLGAFETLSVYVGDRLGWYRSLVQQGPATPAELAARTGTDERYCREWLEMQAAYGILVTDAGTDQDRRRYVLPAGPAEVLTDEQSLAYLAPFSRMISAVGPQLPNLLAAYRDGGGVGWAEFGADARESQADVNRPWFTSKLADELDGVDAVREVLRAPGARILDVGCGVGWSTIALASAYPDASLVGLDVDAPSIEAARAEAAGAGVGDRIDFRLAGGEALAGESPYDAAFLFECLHDMPQPVEVLAAVRRAVRPDGLVVVMDEAVADAFEAPAGEVDQLMYGYSLFVCLPDGRSSEPSAATGTVFRRPILEAYARQAGFAAVEVLPIEDFAFFRFYRLHD